MASSNPFLSNVGGDTGGDSYNSPTAKGNPFLRASKSADERRQKKIDEELARQMVAQEAATNMTPEEEKKAIADQVVADKGRKTKIDEAVKSNRSLEDIKKETGLSTEELKAYTDVYHKGYKDKNLLENIGGFLATPFVAAAQAVGTVGESLATLDPNVQAGIDADIANMQKEYEAGNITKNALLEQYKEKYGRINNISGMNLKVTDKGLEKQTDAEKMLGFAGNFTKAGVDVASVIPAGKALTAAELAIKTAGQQSLKTGLTMGAKLAAKEALVYGSASTASDALNGELSAQGVASNYVAPLIFGAGSRALGTVGGRLIAKGKGVKLASEDLTSKKIIDATPAEIAAAKKIAAKKADSATIDPNDVNALANRAIDEQSGKYDTGTVERAKNWIGNQINPYRALAKIDDAYAKLTGKQRHLLKSSENLEDLARRSAVSEREASSMFFKEIDVPKANGTGSIKTSAADLIKKYDGDSDAGKEFNNYTNAKFDLEFRAKNKGKKQIQTQYTDDQLKSFVDSYEIKNKDAIQDLATKKAVNDMALDYMVDSGAIAREEADQIKSAYKNAVPLERIFPDDLARPEVSGKNVGSIAKQTVVQRLEGGSDTPLSNSFDTMLNRVSKAVSQGNRAKLAQKLLERSEQGLIKGSKVVITAGNKEARAELRAQAQLISKSVRYLNGKIKISNRQMRKIQSELAGFNKQGMKISLKEGGKIPLPDMAVNQLSKLSKTKGKTTTSRAFFKALVETDTPELERIRNKIATREPKLATKLDEVLAHKTQIDAMKTAKQNIKEVTADFVDDPTTGKQLISGIIDGQSYKMEVPPELAKAVQGMDSKKVEGVLKLFATIKKPFEITWTGIFNPVFAAMSFVFYDTPMSVINSPRGFKTLSLSAVKEGFKSIKSSSEFQKALAAQGARPFGGSGASAFTKMDTQAIAAQKNILSNLKYTLSKPEVALSKLDVWGGKLANSTRTRIARAEYDALLKQAKKAGQDITSDEVRMKAMQGAALAYRTVMPDYDTMSHLTRQINTVVPFFAASVAGTRSFGQALRRDPRNTIAKAVTMGILPTVGITAFSLMQPQGQKFYDDMEKSGKTRTLDDNLVIVLPGAEKNDSTGEWTGIVKIPLAPEFRAINQTTWRLVRGEMGGNGPDASHVALSLFDAITGGVRTSENPLITTQKILAGQDPSTGEQLIKGDMANLPTEQQAYKFTSQAGKTLGGILGTSPIQADKILGQFGLVGSTIKGGNATEAVAENVKNRVFGGYGEKASNSFYDTYSPIRVARDAASAEITSLIKQGRRNAAINKAKDFNDSLKGKFSNFYKEYGNSEAYDPQWTDLMNGLIIKTSEKAIDSRAQ